ncbi:recombinase [Pandoraea iniqua]|uniref:Recombinase n=3 Tax=Burkholderiaceae TaxID=119060 RepID=A0A5E4RYD9_9BURK|nr:type II toxin-antitoxin system VapC family toxin [Pandoraea iniqua]ALS63151.1 recombinase [Pandoraea norimbergensis]VVD67933.1 recombinase [Pandoraea iniqua]
MYLLDTNVISECRKASQGDAGVQRFIRHAIRHKIPRFLSVITLGELHRGARVLRHRNDTAQAVLLENWIESVKCDHAERILSIDQTICYEWARLRVPRQEHAIDKLIAATALVHRLVVVTRNVKDFTDTGVEVHNPFLH